MVPFAQRRPGRLPRRHVTFPLLFTPQCRIRSTKAGASAPATLLVSAYARLVALLPLNEGRGVCPGDTWDAVLAGEAWGAQRRPGRLPRRHARACRRLKRAHEAAQRRPGRLPRRHWSKGFSAKVRSTRRSTKAGASAPATRPNFGLSWGTRRAQRRPGRLPRRHATFFNLTG